MDGPDILKFVEFGTFARAWLATWPDGYTNPRLRAMGKQVGLSRAQMWNLIFKDEKVQLDAVPAFARLFGLDDQRREHLRRLVVLQNATPEEARKARMDVWSSHAGGVGVSASALQGLLERDPWDGADEAVAVALLPILRAHAPQASTPEAWSALIPGGPGPDAFVEAAAQVEAGLAFGEARGPRVWRAPTHGGHQDWETACWAGLYGLGREAILRVPAKERNLWVIIGSLDGPAAEAVAGATRRLQRAVREIIRQTAEKPVSRIHALLCSQLQLSAVAERRPGTNRPARLTGRRSLTAPEPTDKAQEEGSTTTLVSPERPCIFRTTSLWRFATAWVDWRKAHGRPASAAWLAGQWGISKAHAHALVTGGAKFFPDHVHRLIQTMDLDQDEAAYAEGLAQHDLATDAQDKGQIRLALIAFAAARGIQTPEGDAFRVAASWEAQAILALADLPGFGVNPAVITRMTGGRVHWQDAAWLVPVLREQGYLAQGGAAAPVVVERYSRDEDHGLALVSFHDGVLRLLRGELRLPLTELVTQGTLLVAPDEALPRIARAFSGTQDEIEQILREVDGQARRVEGGPDRVLLNAMHLFPITPDLRTLPRR